MGLVDNTQSLQVQETPTEIRIQLAADVLFDFDKHDIRPSAATALDQIAGIIRGKRNNGVRVEGYTDSIGTDSYNQRLSERRADAVRVWLVTRDGLGSVRFRVRGFGEARPVAPNSNPDGSDNPGGRQKNRRVEVVVEKADSAASLPMRERQADAGADQAPSGQPVAQPPAHRERAAHASGQ